MPTAPQAGKKASGKPAPDGGAKGAQDGEAKEPEERHYATLPELRTQAETIRKEHGYEDHGEMTPQLLVALEPLLNEAIDPRHIKVTPPVTGKPYESTGIRSVQVQIDRLNAVIGAPHWRKLLFYIDGGNVCHGHIIVGNKLIAANVGGEDGHLIPGEADIVAHRSGWGGHSRGSNRGDLYKGSETNALKRAIAQLGPGHEVYTLDFDEDLNPAATAPPATEPTQAALPTAASGGGEQAQLPIEDAATELTKILAIDDDLSSLRAEVHKGMQLFDMTTEDRLERFRANQTKEQLEQLLNRISVAVDAREAEGS